MKYKKDKQGYFYYKCEACFKEIRSDFFKGRFIIYFEERDPTIPKKEDVFNFCEECVEKVRNILKLKIKK